MYRFILPLTEKEQDLLAEFAEGYLVPNEHVWILRFQTIASAYLKIPKHLKQLVTFPDRLIPELIRALQKKEYELLYKRYYSLGRQLSLAHESPELALSLIEIEMISLFSVLYELSHDQGKQSKKAAQKPASKQYQPFLAAFAKLQNNLRLVYLQTCGELTEARFVDQQDKLKLSLERVKSKEKTERAIRSILQETAQFLDFQELFKVFARCIHDILEYDRVSVALCTENPDEVEIHSLSISGESVIKPGLVINNDCSLIPAIREKKPRIIPDLSQKKACVVCDQLHKEGINGVVILPLILEGKAIGTLNLGSKKAGFFKEEDLPILQEIARALTVAVKNSQEHSHLVETLKHEKFASTVGSRIHSSLNCDEIMRIVGEELTQYFKADRTFIVEIFEPEGFTKVVHEFLNPESKLSNLGLIRKTYEVKPFAELMETLRSGEVIAANTEPPLHSALKQGEQIIRETQAKTLCVVPLFIFGKYWGAITMHHCAQNYFWKKPEIEMLKKIGKDVSKALELAKIYEREKESVTRLEKLLKTQ